MVNEPEKLRLTTVCCVRVFSFLLGAGSLRRCQVDSYRTYGSPSLECGFVCHRLRADQREAGLRRGAEMVLVLARISAAPQARPTGGGHGADHRGRLRHLANSSSLAFCMRRAASVSLRCLDCRASRSAGMPGFKYCCHFFSEINFS
jgi:hypothetical protein